MDPTSTDLEYVDRRKTGEGYDWTIAKQEHDHPPAMSFKEKRKLIMQEKEVKKRGKKEMKIQRKERDDQIREERQKLREETGVYGKPQPRVGVGRPFGFMNRTKHAKGYNWTSDDK